MLKRPGETLAWQTQPNVNTQPHDAPAPEGERRSTLHSPTYSGWSPVIPAGFSGIFGNFRNPVAFFLAVFPL